MNGLEKLCSMVTNRFGKARKQKPNDSKRFVVYYRVSTKQQGESGLGLEAQRAVAEAYVRQHGGEIIGEYQEVETGKNCRRPEIMKAILPAVQLVGSTSVLNSLMSVTKVSVGTGRLEPCQTGIGIRKIGIDPDHLVAVGDGSVILLLAIPGGASIAVGSRSYREPQRWFTSSSRSSEATFRPISVAKSVSESCIIATSSSRSSTN